MYFTHLQWNPITDIFEEQSSPYIEVAFVEGLFYTYLDYITSCVIDLIG